MIILASLFTTLTIIGAFIRIPIPFVPLSLQTFFVLLAGSVLGPHLGAASQLLYLLLGLAGLPIFANGGGLSYVLQPTFGYLMGFPIASFVVGALFHKNTRLAAVTLPAVSFPAAFFSYAAGMVVIFTPGVFYLWLSTNVFLGGTLSLNKALAAGFLVFLPGDLIKLLAASVLYRALQARLSSLASAPQPASQAAGER